MDNVTPPQTPRQGGIFSAVSTGARALFDTGRLAVRYLSRPEDSPYQPPRAPLPQSDLLGSFIKDQPPSQSSFGTVNMGASQPAEEPKVDPKVNEQALVVADFARNFWYRITDGWSRDKALSLGAGVYSEVRRLAPESVREHLPTLDRPAPQAQPEPELPSVKVEVAKCSERKQKIAEQLTGLLRELLVGNERKLYEDEQRFFDALGIYLANQQIPKLLGGLPAEGDLIWETITENPLYVEVIDRLRGISERFDQPLFHRLLPRIVTQLADRFEGVARIILQGGDLDSVRRRLEMPGQNRRGGFLQQRGRQRGSNLCAPLQTGQNERAYLATLLQQFSKETENATGSLLNVMFPSIGADLLSQTVDLLCSEEMIDSYFYSILQLLGKKDAQKAEAMELRKKVELQREEWEALHRLVGSVISGALGTDGIANVVQKQQWAHSLLETSMQSLLSADSESGALRINLGSGAEALERMNRGELSPPVSKEWLERELAQVSSGLYVPGVLPNLYKWCLEYNDLFLRNLIMTVIVETLHELQE